MGGFASQYALEVMLVTEWVQTFPFFWTPFMLTSCPIPWETVQQISNKTSDGCSLKYRFWTVSKLILPDQETKLGPEHSKHRASCQAEAATQNQSQDLPVISHM